MPVRFDVAPHLLFVTPSPPSFASPLSIGDALQALQVTQMVEAPLLRESALFFAEHNLSDISQHQDFHDTVSGVPGLAEVSTSRDTKYAHRLLGVFRTF